MTARAIEAWNNFIFLSNESDYEKGSPRWAAAIAKRYLGAACDGGFNSFLSQSPDIDPLDVIYALKILGARATADELEHIVQVLDAALPVASARERWDLMDVLWRDELHEHDCFSDGTEKELMATLEAHVSVDECFYIELAEGQTHRLADFSDSPVFESRSSQRPFARVTRFLRRSR